MMVSGLVEFKYIHSPCCIAIITTHLQNVLSSPTETPLPGNHFRHPLPQLLATPFRFLSLGPAGVSLAGNWWLPAVPCLASLGMLPWLVHGHGSQAELLNTTLTDVTQVRA